MKLVIDIPEEEYELDKRMADSGMGSPAINRILDGIPYEERKIGKWIVWKDCEGKTRELTCPECGCQRHSWVNPNYCEDCGVKLEVDE